MSDSFHDSLDAARERAGFAHTLGDGTEEYAEKAAGEPSVDLQLAAIIERTTAYARGGLITTKAHAAAEAILTSDWLAAHTAAAEARGAERALLSLADEIAPDGYGWTGLKDAERFKARLRDRAARIGGRS